MATANDRKDDLLKQAAALELDLNAIRGERDEPTNAQLADAINDAEQLRADAADAAAAAAAQADPPVNAHLYGVIRDRTANGPTTVPLAGLLAHSPELASAVLTPEEWDAHLADYLDTPRP